jgi:hypothetical protein
MHVIVYLFGFQKLKAGILLPVFGLHNRWKVGEKAEYLQKLLCSCS